MSHSYEMHSVGKVVNNYAISLETDGKQTYHGDNFELYESEGCSVVSNSWRPHGLYSSWNSLGQNTGVGSLSLLRGIFPTQASNPGLLHRRWILYQLSHMGSLEIFNYCVAYEKQHHGLNGHELEQTLGDSGGQGCLVCCNPRGHKESDMTERLNNNNTRNQHRPVGQLYFKKQTHS